ncbi:MAG: tyrosine-type recombinase/integrase [Solirubrobacteraceae bacterium]
MAQQRVGFKGWTIRGDLTVLGAVFTYASRHLGLVCGNPLATLDRVERPGIDDARLKRILGPDDLRRLIDAVDAPYRLLFELAAETGCRLGEVLGLVWGDIDLDAGTVSFEYQLDCKRNRAPLKTKRSRRSIEITEALTEKLRQAKTCSRANGRHDFVFVSRRGTPYNHRNIAGRVLGRAVERAGLGSIEQDGRVIESAPTFHCLRHSHASALIAAGWDIEEVSARLGHAHCGTTQKTYVHAFDAARRSAARRARLGSLYGRLATASRLEPSNRPQSPASRYRAEVRVVGPTWSQATLKMPTGSSTAGCEGGPRVAPSRQRFRNASIAAATVRNDVSREHSKPAD